MARVARIPTKWLCVPAGNDRSVLSQLCTLWTRSGQNPRPYRRFQLFAERNVHFLLMPELLISATWNPAALPGEQGFPSIPSFFRIREKKVIFQACRRFCREGNSGRSTLMRSPACNSASSRPGGQRVRLLNLKPCQGIRVSSQQ